MKEPRELLFFVGAFYEFTYNDDGKFSQSQIGLLMNLPDQETVNNFRKIPIYVAPPGIKVVAYKMPPHRVSWGEHGKEGWYIGPAIQHYQ